MKRLPIFILAVMAFCVFPGFVTCGNAAVLSGEVTNDTSLKRLFISDPSGFIVDPNPNILINERGIKAGLLYDADNKKIVWHKDMGRVLPIASLTKMMVALLAIEDIHTGKIKWDDMVRWSRETVMRVKGKNKTVYTQTAYNVRDLFKAAMIASNNECAEALARYLEAGDLGAAIDRMNLRARELGMNSTWYGNPTGLPGASAKLDNSSTCEDLLLLALEMIKHPDILEVTGMGYADVSNGQSVNIIRNHNHLTIDYNGDVDGMKTGYTKRAGFCLVATSKTCGRRLISVVLGSTSPGVRNEIVADMINDYYESIGNDKLTQAPASPTSTTVYTATEEQATDSGSIIYHTKVVRTLHSVYKGETLSTIADKYDCSLADLKKWNRLRSSTVAPGKKLIVYSLVRVQVDPVTAATIEPAKEMTLPVAHVAPQTKTVNPVSPKEKYAVYIVQPGDTLTSIAQNYNGVTVQQIKALNRIYNHRSLRVGTKLKVPVSS